MEVTAREDAVKAVATLNSFVDGVRWMRMGMGNDKYHKMLELWRMIKLNVPQQAIRC